jgi:hypothetical protein
VPKARGIVVISDEKLKRIAPEPPADERYGSRTEEASESPWKLAGMIGAGAPLVLLRFLGKRLYSAVAKNAWVIAQAMFGAGGTQTDLQIPAIYRACLQLHPNDNTHEGRPINEQSTFGANVQILRRTASKSSATTFFTFCRCPEFGFPVAAEPRIVLRRSVLWTALTPRV